MNFQAHNSLKEGTHAVVIGGSIAGLLAGRILTNHLKSLVMRKTIDDRLIHHACPMGSTEF